MIHDFWRAAVHQAELLWRVRRAARHADAIFIWIPKAAGTSMYRMLQDVDFIKLKSPRQIQRYFRSRGRVTFGHVGLPELVDAGLVNADYVRRAWKFAIVRDPYERAVSLYNYLHRIGRLTELNKPPCLQEFLEIVGSGHFHRVGLYNERGLSQCNPQWHWIRGVHVDRIYKVETLANELDEFRIRFGAPHLSLGHSNRTAGISVSDLTRSELDLIESVYTEDFARFGYSKR